MISVTPRVTPLSVGLRQKGSNSALYEMSQKSAIVPMPEPEYSNKKIAEIKIGFIDISGFSPTMQFILLTVAVFVFYLVYGYMQELIFKLDGFRPFGWYLTLVQFGLYTIFGLTELQFKADKERRIPLSSYVVIAFLTVSTMGLSNTSVGYLNYPTQVIFKCCKLIPVMFGGVLIQGKKYNCIDVTAVLCMCIGLILFTLADSSVSPSFNTYGVILISLALLADGAIGNVQEKALKQYQGSNSEMVLYSYSIGFIYILVGLVVSGKLLPAFEFCKDYSVETYGYAVIFSISGYCGVNIVLTLVKSFGALIAVTVTTCRKAITIILSFMFFAKPFTVQYVWSGLIVVFGIYLNVYSKNKDSWDTYLLIKYNEVKSLLGYTSIYRKYPSAATDV
ncbi:adenosine 3'-phospho 5'-phosphosulfate transporter 2-like [Mytilus californianus]|uniref:adenosine 3'-phospho 5'-phosphosulfate transporter 2-like n=1 Tax=Mytilus californianus TaxID=6549 RepID=UPI002245D918|nr:adenosine 3'-phospho 5'-phosphosulfate transporter 2-like [Mytilus californianus]